ncbi:MAG: hypothetical protein HPY64_03755 [Anaerolineae bacterium]|nr:hypothetical protein [Anaerolineae bacterium]
MNRSTVRGTHHPLPAILRHVQELAWQIVRRLNRTLSGSLAARQHPAYALVSLRRFPPPGGGT